MKHKIQRFLGVLLCLWTGLAALSLPARAAERGETVTFAITLPEARDAVKSVAFQLSYDSAALEFQSGTWTLSGGVLANVDSGKGTGVIAYASPVSISGTIAAVTLKVKDNAAHGLYRISATIVLNSNAERLEVSVGAVSAAPNAHAFDGGTVTKAATCTESGVRTLYCAGCGATETETIPAAGHVSSGPATTEKAEVCTVCGYEISPKKEEVPEESTEEQDPSEAPSSGESETESAESTRDTQTEEQTKDCAETQKADHTEEKAAAADLKEIASETARSDEQEVRGESKGLSESVSDVSTGFPEAPSEEGGKELPKDAAKESGEERNLNESRPEGSASGELREEELPAKQDAPSESEKESFALNPEEAEPGKASDPAAASAAVETRPDGVMPWIIAGMVFCAVLAGTLVVIMQWRKKYGK